MELKLPPAVVVFVFAFLMYILAEFLPFGHFVFFGQRYLMWLLLFLAIIILVFSVGHFLMTRTTVDPTNPKKASHLVTKGIYAFTRNPMYLAMLLVLLAFGLKLGNAFNILLAATFVAYMNRFQIIPEENALTSVFGKEYQQYCIKVRRWF